MRILLFILCLIPESLYAISCFPLYKAESDKIDERDGFTKNVGGQVLIDEGRFRYLPGITVSGVINNWARDFVRAIEWGPNVYSFSDKDPQKDWLKKLNHHIRHDCHLNDDPRFTQLRNMLTELMNDGSFCPQDKIIKPGLLGGISKFEKILLSSIHEGRFSEICSGASTITSSTRSIKENTPPTKTPPPQIQNSNQ